MSPTNVGTLRLGSTRSYTSSMKTAPVSMRMLLMPLIKPVATKKARQDARAAPSSAAALSSGAKNLEKLRLIVLTGLALNRIRAGTGICAKVQKNPQALLLPDRPALCVDQEMRQLIAPVHIDGLAWTHIVCCNGHRRGFGSMRKHIGDRV